MVISSKRVKEGSRRNLPHQPNITKMTKTKQFLGNSFTFIFWVFLFPPPSGPSVCYHTIAAFIIIITIMTIIIIIIIMLLSPLVEVLIPAGCNGPHHKRKR